MREFPPGIKTDENYRILEVRIKGKTITLGTSLPALQKALGEPDGIEHSECRDTFYVWYNVGWDMYAFHFDRKNTAGEPGVNEIDVSGGY